MALDVGINPGERSITLYEHDGIAITGPVQLTVELVRFELYEGEADEQVLAEDRALAELGIPPDMRVVVRFLCMPYESAYEPTLTERVALPSGRYHAEEVRVVNIHGSPVTSTALGRISPPKILRAAVAAIAGEYRVRTVDPDSGSLVTRQFRQPAELGVAGCWAYGRMIGADPTRYVAEQFGISRQAAAQRVARARKAGQLPPTVQGAH